jgi:hypothetical protein
MLINGLPIKHGDLDDLPVPFSMQCGRLLNALFDRVRDFFEDCDCFVKKTDSYGHYLRDYGMGNTGWS